MRKCVLITFLSFILCGLKVYAKSMDLITVETAGLNMFFTISENKKVSFLYFGDRLVSDGRTTVLNKEYKLRRDAPAYTGGFSYFRRLSGSRLTVDTR